MGSIINNYTLEGIRSGFYVLVLNPVIDGVDLDTVNKAFCWLQYSSALVLYQVFCQVNHAYIA